MMNKKYDLAVIGGGWAGIACAAAAGRRGASVLLIERSNSLGGLATNGFIGGMLGYQTMSKTPRVVVRGEFERLLKKLHAAGGAPLFHAKAGPIHFDPELMKIVAEDMLAEVNVDIMYNTTAIRAKRNGNRIENVELYTTGERPVITAQNYVDCTGNGELIEQCGAEYEFGRPGDGLVQALGLVVYFTGLSPDWVKDAQAIRDALEEERRTARIGIYHANVVAPETAWGYGGMSSCAVRVGGIREAADPRNARELSAAQSRMRQSAQRIMQVCRKVSPAFAHATIVYPSQPGIREARRLKGLYVINESDIVKATKFQDSVARGCYWIDIHCPMGYSDDVFLCNGECQTRHSCRQREEFPQLISAQLTPPEDEYFTIPLRALCSCNTENLQAAGRCLSATSGAIAATRVMAICAATGEAAGVAAVHSSREQYPVSQIDISKLQEDLQQNGALI